MAYIGRQLGQGVRNRFIYTATAGQTTFSGSDDNGGTLVYTDGTYVDVNLNGVELVSGTDYTATSGTSIVLTTGASLNDTLSVTVYDVFAVADTVSAQNGGTFSGDVVIDGTFTSQGIDDNATSTAMTLDSSGNVLVGMPSSSGVKMDVLATTADNLVARFENSHATGSYGISVKAGDDSGNYAADFANKSGTSLMRIRGDGNVGIGTTSPSAPLHVDGVIVQENSSTNITSTQMHFVNAVSGGQYRIRFDSNSSVVGSISVGTSSTAYNTSSDYRLKENVTPLDNASDRLKQIPVHRFNFIADPDTTVDGFLAHEVQAIIPEAVTGAKDAMRDEEYEVTPAVLDDDGNVVTEAVMGTRSVPDYQGIDQSKLVPLLTAALQEALTKIEDLEARVTALETP